MAFELVGREAELATIGRFLAAAEDGPSGLGLEGPAGIGKTRLWSASLAEAEERGYCVLAARAAQPEAQLSLAGLNDLLDGVDHDLFERLPAPQFRALTSALLLEESDAGPDPRALSLAFLAVVRALAARQPTLLAVDDMQWLDRGTAALLSFAARRLAGASVRLFVTQRTGEEDALASLDSALPSFERIEVGPLSLGALGVVLRAVGGPPLTRPALRRVHETAGGNPLFALELARALQRTAARAPALPPTLRSLMQARLQGLPGDVSETLLFAAASASPTQPLLDAVCDGRADVRAAIDAGIAAWDGERLTFTHPLLAASLLEDASPTELRDVHARLAGVVDGDEERARHLAAATADPDEAIAATLDEAVLRLRTRDARAAADLAERALDLTPEDATNDRGRRASIAGSIRCEAGDGVRGGELLRLGIELRPAGAERALAIKTLLGSATRIDDPTALGHEALAQAGDDHTRALLHFDLSEIQLVRCELGESLAHSRQAVELASKTGDALLRVRALARRANRELIVGAPNGDESLDEAQRLEHALHDLEPGDAVTSPRNIRGRVLFWRDELEAARTLFLELDAFARDAQAEEWRPNVCLHLVRIELRAGNFDAARAWAAEAYDIAEASGFTQVLGATLAMQALIAAHAGEEEQARRLLADSTAVTLSVQDRWHGFHNRVTSGMLDVCAGHYDDALVAVGTLAEELDEIGIRDPGILLFEREAIEAFVAAGQRDHARALVERLERAGAEFGRPRALASALRGRALLAGSSDEAFAAFEAALREHDRFDDPLDRGRTLLLFGTAERRARRLRAARAHLDEAAQAFEGIGANAFAARAHDELERLGGRRSAVGLTATENRVAALVAQGLTNGEVATALVVTVSTVEAHLTRIYAKLGIRSRAQLVRSLSAG